MLTGSCCCKRVKFQIKEVPSTMGSCYCSRCRKVGASTIIFVSRENVEIIEGKEEIKTYHPEEGYKFKRDFCSHCGSSLGEITSPLDSIPIPANTIDDNLELEISFHEYVEDKPRWIKA